MSTSVPKSVPLARPDTRMPDKIGKYVVVREVGRGSTGIVYLSHDAYYGRDVAIKVYNMDTGGDEERARIARKMFLSQAHLVGLPQQPTRRAPGGNHLRAKLARSSAPPGSD